MLILSDKSPLGTGRHRKCFFHPDNEDLCVKIIYNYGDGGEKEVRRELSYLNHLKKTLSDWSCIPRYHGTVETDLGVGYIYDLVRDFDGKFSENLETKILQCQCDAEWEKLKRVLPKLKTYLFSNHICTMNIKSYNILCKKGKDGNYTPIICDNLGESTFLPIARWSYYICNKKLERQWDRFLKTSDVSRLVE